MTVSTWYVLRIQRSQFQHLSGPMSVFTGPDVGIHRVRFIHRASVLIIHFSTFSSCATLYTYGGPNPAHILTTGPSLDLSSAINGSVIGHERIRHRAPQLDNTLGPP